MRINKNVKVLNLWVAYRLVRGAMHASSYKIYVISSNYICILMLLVSDLTNALKETFYWKY